jgi:hypothetical protein
MWILSWLTRPRGTRFPSPMKRPRPACRLGVEALESRELPAPILAITDVSVVSAILTGTLSKPTAQAAGGRFNCHKDGLCR